MDKDNDLVAILATRPSVAESRRTQTGLVRHYGGAAVASASGAKKLQYINGLSFS